MDGFNKNHLSYPGMEKFQSLLMDEDLLKTYFETYYVHHFYIEWKFYFPNENVCKYISSYKKFKRQSTTPIALIRFTFDFSARNGVLMKIWHIVKFYVGRLLQGKQGNPSNERVAII